MYVICFLSKVIELPSSIRRSVEQDEHPADFDQRSMLLPTIRPACIHEPGVSTFDQNRAAACGSKLEIPREVGSRARWRSHRVGSDYSP